MRIYFFSHRYWQHQNPSQMIVWPALALRLLVDMPLNLNWHYSIVSECWLIYLNTEQSFLQGHPPFIINIRNQTQMQRYLSYNHACTEWSALLDPWCRK